MAGLGSLPEARVSLLLLLLLLLLYIIVSFIQGSHTHIPETNHVPRGYFVTAILSLLFMVPLCLVPVLVLLFFNVALSEVCVQCPIWLFSVVL